MRRFTFSIIGNQEDPAGNAIPKLRMTQNTLWTRQAQRYAAWKLYIQEQFWRGTAGTVRFGKPFQDPESFMELDIVWANRKHGDGESIFGSIADALWENDKFLDGKFTHRYSEEKKGKVIVTITLRDDVTGSGPTASSVPSQYPLPQGSAGTSQLS